MVGKPKLGVGDFKREAYGKHITELRAEHWHGGVES